MEYDGRLDDNASIHRKAQTTVQQIAQDARNVTNTDAKRKMESHAAHCETKYELDAMIGIAQTQDGIPIAPEQLDSNPYLLNCRNGVVDLPTGKLREHRECKHLLLTKMAATNYDV
jgi:putative DNA primase/helicase